MGPAPDPTPCQEASGSRTYLRGLGPGPAKRILSTIDGAQRRWVRAAYLTKVMAQQLEAVAVEGLCCVILTSHATGGSGSSMVTSGLLSLTGTCRWWGRESVELSHACRSCRKNICGLTASCVALLNVCSKQRSYCFHETTIISKALINLEQLMLLCSDASTWLISRVAQSEVKYPTPSFPKYPTPTPQHNVNEVCLLIIL